MHHLVHDVSLQERTALEKVRFHSQQSKLIIMLLFSPKIL
jgi:hypothetical protein